MANYLPVLYVCDNKPAHDEKAFFFFEDRTFFVLMVVLPFSEEECMFFSTPRPELVHELMLHRGSKGLVIRHTFCPTCQDEVSLEVASVIREANRLKL